MLYKWATQAIDAENKVVAITVLAAAATGTNTADVELIGGKLVGVLPTGNQDQFVDNVELSAAGLVTVTLAANATANNTFNGATVACRSQSGLKNDSHADRYRLSLIFAGAQCDRKLWFDGSNSIG